MEQIDKAFDGKQVLQNVTLDIPDGQICGIFGKSGIGKSTLAKVLCGICPPDGGQILLDGQCLVSQNTPYDRKLGLSIQMVYQQPYATLDPHQKIGSGFKELIRYHGFAPKGKERALTEDVLVKVGLEPQILAHLPHQISGGEAQRVAIARCLLFRPKLLILDEATSMLDVSTQANVLGMDLLGVKVPAITIPVRPGRNLAIILEVAAMNNRQKKMGYNAAAEFTEQINRHFDETAGQSF